MTFAASAPVPDCLIETTANDMMIAADHDATLPPRIDNGNRPELFIDLLGAAETGVTADPALFG